MSVAPVATSPGRTACLCALEHTECSLTGCPGNIPPQLHSAGEKVKKHKTKTTLGSPGGRAKGKEERKKGRKRRFAPSHTRFRASLAEPKATPGNVAVLTWVLSGRGSGAFQA